MSAPLKKRFAALEGKPRQVAVPGKGYSAFVRVMRLALPLAAIGIIGLLLSWPRVEDAMAPVPDATALPATVAKNELVNPRFESLDGKNQPFALTAKRAVQSARDPAVVLLDGPMADIALNDGSWMAAEAVRGAYRQEADRLLLQGGVRLFHDKGYEMTTEKLLINLKDRDIWSDTAVRGQGPAGTLEATGLQASGASGQLIFTGPVKLVLNRAVGGLP